MLDWGCFRVYLGLAAGEPCAPQDALEILRAAPKPSASQELRALQILSQAHQGKGDKTGTDAVHESLKRFQQSDNRSAEVRTSATHASTVSTARRATVCAGCGHGHASQGTL